MRFHRFPTIATMTAFAAEYAVAAESPVRAEVMIYTDNNGLTWRPGIALVQHDGKCVMLRWNAFTEETVDFMGLKAKRDANIAGEWFADQVHGAMSRVVRAA